MPVESPFTHITDLVNTNPVGATDDVSEGDDHIRGLKTVLLTDFPNINAAVTADPTDLNRTDITTEGTGEASKVLTADGSGNVDLTPLTVTADTQSPSDNSTKLATTAYADLAGAGITHSGTNFTTTGGATLGEATNIPSTASQVVLSLVGVSLNGAGSIFVELGDSSYAYAIHLDAAVYSTTQNTSIERHILSRPDATGDLLFGTVTFTRIAGTNSWSISGTTATSTEDPYYIVGGFTATGTVDRIRVTAATSTFDAGVASVYWFI